MSAGKMTAGRPGDRGPVQGFFVTGTGTDVGKTAFTAALLRALRGRGVAAQALMAILVGLACLLGWLWLDSHKVYEG